MNQIFSLPAILTIVLPIGFWILPLAHGIVSRSWVCLGEVFVLLALAVGLPFAIGMASDSAYGLASVFRLNDVLLILTMQMSLWLAAMIIALLALRDWRYGN